MIRTKTEERWGIVLVLFCMINLIETIPLCAQDFWQQTRGPEGGSIRCIKVNLDNEIFAALDNARIIYKSSDFGNSWVRLPNSPFMINTMSITSAGDLFIGTWYGIYRSQDKGQSWQGVNKGLTTLDIQSLACNRVTQHLFAGTYQGGIYRSTDNGNNWIAVNTGLINFENISIDGISFSSSGDAVYAAGARYGGGGVYRSTDNGDNWEQINGNLATTNVRSVLAISATEILAATSGGGVYKTLDGGTNWNTSNTGFDYSDCTMLLMGPSNTIYLGSFGRGLFSSTDQGDSWISHSSMVLERDVLDMSYNSLNNDIYLGMSNCGMYRSTDNGSSWTAINHGIIHTLVEGITISANNTDIFAATYGAGIFRSVNSGIDWTPINNGLTDPCVLTIKIKQNSLLAGTERSGLFQSSDNGNTWVQCNNYPSQTIRYLLVAPNGLIFAGSYSSIYRSNGDCSNWSQVYYKGGPTPISSIVVNLNTGSLFATYMADSGIVRSDLNGDTWNAVNTGLTTRSILGLTVSPDGRLWAWACGTDEIYRIFYSDNNGDNWTELDISAFNFPMIIKITCDRNGNLFLSTDTDVYRSIDKGISWENINSGLKGSVIYTFALDSADYMFAGSEQDGIFKSTQTTLTPAPPKLVSPSNVASGVKLNPTFSWTATSGNYHLQVAVDTAFTNLIIDVYNITTTSYTYEGTGLGFNITYYWRVDVTSGGLTSYKSNVWSFVTEQYPTELYLFSTINYPSYASPDKFASTDYRIFGLPGNDYMLLGEFMGGKAGVNWQAYWDNGATDNYLVKYVGTDIFRMVTGRAFWVINNGPIVIDIHVTPASLNADYEAEIDLQTGWNLITNPFLLNIDWVTVQNENMVSNQIIEFTGAGGMWQDRTVMQPYVGYYFYNGGSSTKLRIPYSARVGKPAVARPVIDWQVTIKVAADGIEDHFTRFGVAESASNDLDELDFRKPRAIEDLAGACFYRPEWDRDYPVFATDIRKPITASEVWEFKVNALPQKNVKLTFTDLGQIPAELAIYLVDKAYSRCIDLRSQVDYDFVAVTKESEFEVVVGTESAIRDRLNAIIPREYALGKNFPNPFNPVTTIPVSLPQQTRISLTIYNLLGQQITALYDGTLPAGIHYFVWEGTDYSGVRMPSGVYLYRLSTDKGLSFTGKMVLVK